MYRPPHYAVSDVAKLQALIQAHSLGVVITRDLEANHIPLLPDPTRGPYGTLLAARADEQVDVGGGEAAGEGLAVEGRLASWRWASRASRRRALPKSRIRAVTSGAGRCQLAERARIARGRRSDPRMVKLGESLGKEPHMSG